MDILKEVFIDSAKMLPLLFIVYLLIEFLEHKNNNFAYHILMKSNAFGPVLGALFGCIPQCGFSVIASDLYARGAVALGTLVAIFISTSDEAIPILLSNPDMLIDVVKILATKFVIAVIFGCLINVFIKKQTTYCCEDKHHTHFHGNCESCEGGILKSAIVHSLKIFVFIFVVSYVLELIVHHTMGDDMIIFFNKHRFIQPFITSLVGLIPNCASSVILTQGYIEGAINLASLIGGLCASAGVGLVVLFKLNKNLKNNFLILLILYLTGVISGQILQFII
ncbi:MAG: hypothetical protein E7404_08310 [Ruminococcaceae bacterium]|nr:hypothetical protein [Oscillospiraceae bacterium]